MELDDVDISCNSLRKPGGLLVISIRAAPVPNPGVSIPSLFQLKLTLAVTASNYFDYTSRPITLGLMTWASMKHFKQLDQINDK